MATLRTFMFLAFLLLASPWSFSGEKLANGSFESGLANWAPFEVDLISPPNFVVSDGNFAVDLNAFEAGSVNQVFHTLRKINYTVSFDMSANTSCGPLDNPEIKKVRVFVNDIDMTISNSQPIDPVPPHAMFYQTRSFTFTGSGKPTRLGFVSKTDGACGVVIDNVSVIEPEDIEDEDSDGVPDEFDQCPGTPANEVVDDNGCSGDQTTELDCGCDDFPNHGQYMACVKRVAVDLHQRDIITGRKSGQLIREAAKSSCGGR